MNLTISVDEEILRRARERARAQGKSLQTLLREYLEALVGVADPRDRATELFRIMDESPGRSGGHRFRRDEAYEDRT